MLTAKRRMGSIMADIYLPMTNMNNFSLTVSLRTTQEVNQWLCQFLCLVKVRQQKINNHKFKKLKMNLCSFCDSFFIQSKKINIIALILWKHISSENKKFLTSLYRIHYMQYDLQSFEYSSNLASNPFSRRKTAMGLYCSYHSLQWYIFSANMAHCIRKSLPYK